MKIRVSMLVDVDPSAWTANYGVEGASAIREDVKTYCEEAVREQLQSVGVWQGN